MKARRDRWIVWVIMIGVLVIITMPYLYAAAAGDPGRVFGGFLQNPKDNFTYLAKMYQGWQGQWKFSLPYTAERGSGAYLNLIYLALGHLAWVTGLPLIITFHLGRLASAVMLLFTLWWFFRQTLGDTPGAVLAFALAALGSGMGWMLVPFGSFTADFWVAEAYPLLSAYTNPHFPISLALLLIILGSEDLDSTQRKITLGLAAFFLALVSPFGVAVALAVLGLLAGWEALASRAAPAQWLRLPETQRFLYTLAAGLPYLLYTLWAVRADPVLAGWNAQNQTPAPPLWDTFVSLCPALLLALPGGWALFYAGQKRQRVLLVWTVTGLVMLYFPWVMQRRFMMGLFVPICGLAAVGVEHMAASFRLSFKWLAMILVILSLPTNLLVWMAGIHGIQTQNTMIYLDAGEVKAMDWLQANSPPGALVLAAPETALYLPAFTGRRVIYGHPFETVNAGAERKAVEDYFTNPAANGEFLRQRGVDYVFIGPRERILSDWVQPPGLKRVYSMDGVSLYAVER